ncbi:MAG: hypothetical protein LBS41_03475 [Streptococcaceae bacterium]|jgi:hypothetical protein|nr:hypothetical protein [Streptococcaceae bacterium]
MGKYQLDYKGQAAVQKFHDKKAAKSSDKQSKQSKLVALKAQYLAKKKSGQK